MITSRVALPCLVAVSVLGSLFSSLNPAIGEVSTDQPGAIVIFPKITSSQSQETIVQLSNAGGSNVLLHCFYINGALAPDTNQPVWSVTDFQIQLTRQQPTVWVAGEGLPPVPPDRPADLYPGPIPPVDVGFVGELRCVVVNASDNPISRNVLTGEATLIDRVTHATSKYQAVAVQGLPGNNGDNILLLNNVEYSSCPRFLLLNHFFDGAPDPVLKSPITSQVTLVPCSMDLEHAVPGNAAIQLNVSNEFEQRFSATLNITCFADLALSDISHTIFSFALQGTLVGQTRFRPVLDGDTAQGHGIVGIAQEFRDNGQTASGLNFHFIGGNLQADVLTLPALF